MQELIKKLNQEVANFGVLYTKLHNFHWFVKGKGFYQLHTLFENLYNEVTLHFDEIAERIIQLEGKPFSTLKEFLENATVSEAKDNLQNEEMIKETINDFSKINEELLEAIKTSDDVTADILTAIAKSLQKHVWMLKQLLL